MQNQNLKRETYHNRTTGKFLCVLALLCSGVLCLSGCAIFDVAEFVKPEKAPSDEDIYRGYYRTVVKKSSTADVLATIHLPEYELLSQSKSVIASSGQKKQGYKLWFKMVAFDENELTAQRRYLFIEDEKPKILFTEPWTGFEFKCGMVMSKEVLEKPYNNENARRIAILEQVLENFRKDIEQVNTDNKQLAVCGMLVNQALEAVLLKLDKSPAEAAGLHEEAGVEFDHLSLDKGKILMVAWNDIVRVKLKLGSFEHKFEE